MNKKSLSDPGDPGGDFCSGIRRSDLQEDLRKRRKIIEEILKKEKKDGTNTEFISESELTLDSNEPAGIKIKYQATLDEVYNCIETRSKNKGRGKAQIRYTIIHGILISLLIFAASAVHNQVYYALSLIPIFSIILMWILPSAVNMSTAKKTAAKGRLCVDVFRESILVKSDGAYREIKLNGTSLYEEVGDTMIITPPEGDELMIPERVIDPEYLPDVQAMISAGTRPFSG